MKDKTLTKTLTIRISQADKEKLKLDAQSQGRNIGSFLRWLAEERRKQNDGNSA